MTEQQSDNILAHLVARRRGTDTQQPILSFDNGEHGVTTRSYAELYDNAEQSAGFLIKQGMQPGERVSATDSGVFKYQD